MSTRATRIPNDKGLVRALVHRGAKGQRTPPAAVRVKGLADETMCERCGNVYRDKRWLAGTSGERAWPVGFGWSVCPACRQIVALEFYGRVLIRGRGAMAQAEAIQMRIENIAARARFTQPQRRIVSLERHGDEIEVLTTSQKLAHRIVAGLLHAFGGKATFAWSSEDGALHAIWTWEGAGRGARPQRPARRNRGKRVPEVEVVCRNVDLDPAWRERIERRVQTWGERFPKLTRVRMVLTHGPHHRHGSEEVAARASLPRSTPQATKRGTTMVIALRQTMNALGRELDGLHEERLGEVKLPGGPRIRKRRDDLS